ncbi:MAG: efflux RND transporter permease subunit, partial [Burkholderiales bacterium]
MLLSGFVSLTLTPMMCSRILKPHRADQRHGRLYMAFERGFDAIRDAYDASLSWTLAHKRLVMVLFAGICIATGVLFVRAPKGFLPSEDSGQLFAFIEGPQDASFEAMAELQHRVAEIIRKDPNVEAAMSFIGATGFSPSLNVGRITITLKPFSERKPADQVVRELRPKLANVLGAKVFLQNVPAIRIGGSLTRSPYQYVLRAPDTEELYHWAPIVERKLRSLPGLVDVASDLQIVRPEVTVHIEREKASALGVSAQQIEMALNNAYGSRQVSTIYTPTNQFWVIMELAQRYQTDPSVMPMLYVRSSTGALVPLNAVARFSSGVGPLQVTHHGQLPSVTLSFDVRPGVALSQAISEVQAGMRELKEQGEFKDGVFRRRADVEGKRNLDGYQAIWEHVNERPMVYPKPRYPQPIFMDPANYEWVPVAGQPGVAEKLLGVFTERRSESSLLRLDGGASYTARGKGVYVVTRGAGTVGDQTMRALTTVYLEPGETVTFNAREET